MSFYGLEQPLVAHVQAACASVAFVAGVADPQAIERNLQFVQEPSPVAGSKHGAVFIVPAPNFFGLVSETARGECQLNVQRWVLAVCTRESSQIDTAFDGTAHAARVTNGPMVTEVLAAMAQFRWTAVGDRSAGKRTVKRIDISGLPGTVVYGGSDGVYITLLCYEADMTGSSVTAPGVTYPGVGTQGPPGPPGEDGNTILSGIGAPSNVLGVDDDFYIDRTTWQIYGPKAGGVWGSPTSLIGAQGAPGVGVPELYVQQTQPSFGATPAIWWETRVDGSLKSLWVWRP